MITTTVRQILRAKGHDVWSVSPEVPVLEALRLMAEKDVGAVVVLTDGALVGILSERDYARKIVLRGRASETTPVSAIMSTRVVYVRPELTSEECLAVMTDKRIRHLPILEDGRLIGVISIGDVVKAMLADQRFTIEQLEGYISGAR
jgi:CBS domain-containing protein